MKSVARRTKLPRLDIGVVIFVAIAVTVGSVILLPLAPQAAQTLLIGGVTALAIMAAVWGK